MSYKNLFRVAYILFVLAQIPSVFTSNSSVISSFYYSLNLNSNLLSALLSLSGFLISIGILYLLFQFMEPILRFFKIDTIFKDEEFSLSIAQENIPIFFSICFGLYLIISSIPYISYYGIDFLIAQNDSLNHVKSDNSSYLLIEFLNVVLGFALIAFCKPLASWINQQVNGR